jgi:hypothetical protein
MAKECNWNILIEKEIHKLVLLLVVYGNDCKMAAASEKELLVFLFGIAGNVKAKLVRCTALKQRDEKAV